MEKDFTVLAGWLRFFYIVFIVRLVVSVVLVIAIVCIYFMDHMDLFEGLTLVDCADYVLSMVVIIFLIKNYKVRSEKAKNILVLLNVLLCVIPITTACISAIVYIDVEFVYPSHIIVPLLFISYLKSSKRAKVFYLLPEPVAQVTLSYEDSKAYARGMVKMTLVSMAVIAIPFGIMLLLIE